MKTCKHAERYRTILTSAILLLCAVYFLPRWADPNQNSRLDMVVAVVDDGSFQIDEYVWNTVDYAEVNGHYYSDKAPGAAFLGIPVYALLRNLFELPLMNGLMSRLEASEALSATLREDGTGLLVDKVRFAIAQVAVTLVTAALPTALLGALMFRLLAHLTPQPWPRAGVVLAYGLLTPVLAYSGAFYGHQLSAACLFFAFYLLFTGTGSLSAAKLMLVGFLFGYSVITEYPAALVAAILFVYAFQRLADRRRIIWVLLGGAPVAAGWMVYNTAVFGAPLALGYSHSALWVEQHHAGFMSLTWPHWQALWGITCSPFRGLFWLSPLLLLAVPGFILWYRSRQHRPVFWVAMVSTLTMFLFNSSSIMWWGGFAVGPRYILPALAFMALPLVFVFCQSAQQLWLSALSFILSAWSFVATWGLTLADQAFPPDTLRNPLLEYAWPAWREGNIARNLGMFLGLPGAASLLPLLVLVAALLAALWLVAHREPVEENGP